jgi:hypothetical protein
MAEEKVSAYELSKEFVPSSNSPVTFAGTPGVWEQGMPIGIDELQLTEDEMDELIKEHGLPLQKSSKKVDAQVQPDYEMVPPPESPEAEAAEGEVG